MRHLESKASYLTPPSTSTPTHSFTTTTPSEQSTHLEGREFGGCLCNNVLLARPAEQPTQLGEHAPEALLELHELAQALLEGRGELQQAQCVPRGRRVKDDAGVVHGLDEADDLGKAHRLVNPRNGAGDVREEAAAQLRQIAALRVGVHLLRGQAMKIVFQR